MSPFITITSDGNHSEIYVNGQLVPHVKQFLIANDEEGTLAKLIIEEDCELDTNIIEAIQELGFIDIFQEGAEEEASEEPQEPIDDS